jgi:hypothetical protein
VRSESVRTERDRRGPAGLRRKSAAHRWAEGLTLAILAFAPACKSRSEPQPLASAVVVPAPPPPKGLAAELVVPRPNEFWVGVRGLLGTVGELLPKSAELAFGTSVGLSPIAATSLDLSAPLVGAVALEGPRQAFVLAVRVTSGAELVAHLTTGNTPTHRVQNDGAVRVLEPIAAARPGPALAVLDDMLLVGTRAELPVLGPYVVRALGRRSPQKPDGAMNVSVSAAALRDVIVPSLRALLGEKREFLEQTLKLTESAQGRSADLADPRAVLRGLDTVAEDGLAALAKARGIEARLLPEATRLLLDVEFFAGTRAASTLADVPLAFLYGAPDDALLRVSLGRAEAAAPADLGVALNELFGERLTAADRAKLEEAVRLVEAGRGRAQLFGSRGDGMFWSGDVSDAKQLEQGLSKLIGLLGKKPFGALAGVTRARLEKRRVEGLAEPVHAATIELARPVSAQVGLIPRKLGLVWAVGASEFTLAAAAEPEPLFRALAARRADATSGAASRALLAPFERAAVAGLAELGALPLFGQSGPGKTVGFALGQEPEVTRLRVAATPSAVVALARMVH